MAADAAQSALEPTTPVDFDLAFRRMKADETLQFDLPDQPRPDLVIEVVEGRRRFDFNFDSDMVGNIGEFILWCGVGALALFLLYYLGLILRDRWQARKVNEHDQTPELYTPDGDAVRTILQDVDTLAAEGRFAEAVHELLLRAVREIDRSRAGLVRRSLTAREIGLHPLLTGDVREAFLTIAQINELGWFGKRSISEDQFATARAAYAQFERPKDIHPSLFEPAGLPA